MQFLYKETLTSIELPTQTGCTLDVCCKSKKKKCCKKFKKKGKSHCKKCPVQA